MKFTKMQGSGNDYVYVNCFEETVEDPAEAAVKVSNRNFGIGSDGLILIGPSKAADCKMEMYNLDGSHGIMCGNGVRCVGKYVYEHGIVEKTTLKVETPAGIRELTLHEKNGRVETVTVNMGTPRLTSQMGESIKVQGKTWSFYGISMGNPHAVLFVDRVDGLEIAALGPCFETHPRFPDRTNTEFVEILDRGHVKMRVWERGSGETLACGTGACAAAVACCLDGKTGNQVDVELLGGTLRIEWDREKDLVYMTGPAVEVYHGEIDLSHL